MLETTPRHWNGVVCVWIEGCTLALMQSNQCEILGIASHALMNWHSGLAAITRVGSGSGRWGEGRAAVVTERGGKAPRANVCFNEHTSSHTFYNFETAWGLLHWSWCLLTCPRRPWSRGLLQHSDCNNYRLTMLYDLVEHHVKGRKQLA